MDRNDDVDNDNDTNTEYTTIFSNLNQFAAADRRPQNAFQIFDRSSPSIDLFNQMICLVEKRLQIDDSTSSTANNSNKIVPLMDSSRQKKIVIKKCPKYVRWKLKTAKRASYKRCLIITIVIRENRQNPKLN